MSAPEEVPATPFDSDPMTAEDLTDFAAVAAHRDKLVADGDLQALVKRALADVLAGVKAAAKGALDAGEASLPLLEPLAEAAVRGLVAGELDNLKGKFGA